MQKVILTPAKPAALAKLKAIFERADIPSLRRGAFDSMRAAGETMGDAWAGMMEISKELGANKELEITVIEGQEYTRGKVKRFRCEQEMNYHFFFSEHGIQSAQVFGTKWVSIVRQELTHCMLHPSENRELIGRLLETITRAMTFPRAYRFRFVFRDGADMRRPA